MQFMKPILYTMSIVLLASIMTQNASSSLLSLADYLDTQSTKEQCTVRARQLSQEDACRIFGPRANRLFNRAHQRRPIYPLQLSITNDSATPVRFDPDTLPFALMDYSRVLRRLTPLSGIQIAGTVLTTLLLSSVLGLATACIVGATYALVILGGSTAIVAPLTIGGAAAAVTTPLFLIIGTPVRCVHTNKEIKQDEEELTALLEDCTLAQTLIIPPHTTRDCIIFVAAKDYTPHFTLILMNHENPTECLSFDIHVKRRSLKEDIPALNINNRPRHTD
jgi:hypothetical protein